MGKDEVCRGLMWLAIAEWLAQPMGILKARNCVALSRETSAWLLANQDRFQG